MKRLSSMLLALVLAVMACSQVPGQVSPTPTPRPATQVARTPTPPADATEPAGEEPTSQPTEAPTATDEPEPTEAPEDLYEHDSAGFALTLPDDWLVDSEDATGAGFVDERGAVYLFIYQDVNSEALSPDELAEVVITDLTTDEIQVKRIDDGELNLGDGLTVPALEFNYILEDGGVYRLWVGTATNGARRHFIYLYVFEDELEDQTPIVEGVLGSLRFINTLFGLERRETLVLLGGDPEPEDLDPARDSGSAAGYGGLLYAGLVRLSPQLQIVPELAESWTLSPDGVTYTFTLRDGLTFGSGQPLTAADVAASWERAADPETGSTTARTYLGDILGVDEMLDGEADHITGLNVIDDRTLAVTLDAPKAYFLAKLTYPTAFVINLDNVAAGDEDEWMFDPDPSGPYQLRDYTEDEVIIFERNPAYHSPVGVPYVVYRLQVGGTPLSLYEIGDIDMVGLQPADSDRISQPGDPLHAEWQTSTSMCTTLLQFDITEPPLDDPDVRRALVLALDRPGLNDQITEGAALLASSVLPPAMPGFNPDLPTFEFDPQAAADALAASTYAGGDLPTIIVNEGGLGQAPSDFITAVADMWREALGVEVEIRQLDPQDFSGAAREQHGHVVSYGWCADYPDPENFLDILYHTDSEFNVAGYTHPQVDALLEAARSEPDAAVRLDLYHQAETLIVGEVGAIPLMHGVAHILVKPYVKGFVLVPIGAPIIPLLTLDFGE